MAPTIYNVHVALCRSCWCMTKTVVYGRCGKCGARKRA